MKSVYHVFQAHDCNVSGLQDEESHETCIVTRRIGSQYFVCTRSGIVHYCTPDKLHPFVHDTRDTTVCCLSKYTLSSRTEADDWEARDLQDYADGHEGMDASKLQWNQMRFKRLAEDALRESEKVAQQGGKSAAAKQNKGKKMSLKNQASRAQLQSIGFDPVALSMSYASSMSKSNTLNISTVISLTSSGAYLGGEANVLNTTPRAIWCKGRSFVKQTPENSYSTRMTFAFLSEKNWLAQQNKEDMFPADYFWETLLLHNSANSDSTSNEVVRKYQESQSELAKSITSLLSLCKERGLTPNGVHGLPRKINPTLDAETEAKDKSVNTVMYRPGICNVSIAKDTCELIRRDMKCFKDYRVPPEDWVGQLVHKYGKRRVAAGLRVLLLVLMHCKWIQASRSHSPEFKKKVDEFVDAGYHSNVRASLLQHAVREFTDNREFVDQLFTVLINSAISSSSNLAPHPLWLYEYIRVTRELIQPSRIGGK